LTKKRQQQNTAYRSLLDNCGIPYMTVAEHALLEKEEQALLEKEEQALLLKQCCGSGMFIPDPDFYPSRIPDLGSKNSNKSEGWKKIWCHTFFCSHNFTKL
jgi:hypothetical protein